MFTKYDDREHQKRTVLHRQQLLAERGRNEKIYLLYKRGLKRKEREDFEIATKNIIIRKCRHSFIVAQLLVQQVVRKLARHLHRRRGEIMLAWRRRWAVASVLNFAVKFLARKKAWQENGLRHSLTGCAILRIAPDI